MSQKGRFARHVCHATFPAKRTERVDVDVDVMMSGLVPFLLCPLLQGPCVGPSRPEANFLRRTPSTWRTGINTSISLGSRQPCWRSSCYSFKRALAHAPSGVTWLLPSKSTQGVKPSDGGLPDIVEHLDLSNGQGMLKYC